jgi:hypothetical protein
VKPEVWLPAHGLSAAALGDQGQCTRSVRVGAPPRELLVCRRLEPVDASIVLDRLLVVEVLSTGPRVVLSLPFSLDYAEALVPGPEGSHLIDSRATFDPAAGALTIADAPVVGCAYARAEIARLSTQHLEPESARRYRALVDGVCATRCAYAWQPDAGGSFVRTCSAGARP